GSYPECANGTGRTQFDSESLMVAVTQRALPLLSLGLAEATQAKLTASDDALFTTNPVCHSHNCINPFAPGLMDIPRLAGLIWQCSPAGEVKKYLTFCKDAIDYDAAVPTANASAALNKVVLSQDSAASTMYFYHLNALGYDAWDYKHPAESDDACIKSIYKLSCLSYFPKNEAGCKVGSQVPFLRPCRNACGSYLEQCHVECCDASTQCVFEHTETDGSQTFGYYDADGPSALCTGGASRVAPLASVLLLLLGLQMPRSAFGPAGRYLLGAVLLLCASSLQGCSLFIPSHRVPNWKKESDYLVDFEYVPEGMPETASTLNSCRTAQQGDKVCSGHGQCKPWSIAPLKVSNGTRASFTSFCECDYLWADPECRTRRKSQVKAFLLSLFLGFLGADRFYLGFFYSALPGIDLSAWLAAQCLPPSEHMQQRMQCSIHPALPKPRATLCHPPIHPPTRTHARYVCTTHPNGDALQRTGNMQAHSHALCEETC
ncbi:unnamed protein product, partial [Effrenium voratum]